VVGDAEIGVKLAPKVNREDVCSGVVVWASSRAADAWEGEVAGEEVPFIPNWGCDILRGSSPVRSRLRRSDSRSWNRAYALP
jgi:hypothetical protein